ncbi:MAG: LVIVD repeat-containing protein, partial [Candidatus Rokuibacteriota bacterium]
MTRCRRLPLMLLGLLLVSLAAAPASSQAPTRGHGAQAHDMELVGYDDLQGRSAYQPLPHRQGGRFIAYVGHHGGRARNPLTGVDEDNGTSIVDVTDPARPRYLAHIPGIPGAAAGGGAQMVRVCEGSQLPKGTAGKTYLLRTVGNSMPGSGHEIWDVSDPAKPQKLVTVVTGLTSTHKNFWECDTGIAYLVAGDLVKRDPLELGPSGWRTWRMTKIYDLSDPARPVFIRDFGLAGQEPGSTGPVTVAHGLHGPIRLGNRVYFAHGTSAEGMLQIVDRDKLLTGSREPTAANLNFPEISRLHLSPAWGGHTAFPVLGVSIPDWAANTQGRT